MAVHEIALTDEQEQFVARQIQAGCYRSIDDLLRAGLELLEQEISGDSWTPEWLRKEIKIGIEELDAGNGTVLSSKEEIEAFVAGLGPQPHAIKECTSGPCE